MAPTTTEEQAMFKVEYVYVQDIKPGMRTALVERDGTVVPHGTVTDVAPWDKYDGWAITTQYATHTSTSNEHDGTFSWGMAVPA